MNGINLRQPASRIARALLGATLSRTLDSGEVLTGIITETEAYTGPEDLCSHARNGHRSARNESMWAEPGTLYVYFTYGMHCCANISCYQKDHPAAVLIRALHPVQGLDSMRINRTNPRRKSPLKDSDLCSGPAKLCQALGITLEHNGEYLPTSKQFALREGAPVGDEWVENTARIGVGSGHEWSEAPLRWVVKRGWRPPV